MKGFSFIHFVYGHDFSKCGDDEIVDFIYRNLSDFETSIDGFEFVVYFPDRELCFGHIITDTECSDYIKELREIDEPCFYGVEAGLLA